MNRREFDLLYEVAATAFATDWPTDGRDYAELQVGRKTWEELREWIREKRRLSKNNAGPWNTL